jgi:NADPH-dependent 2,4-dienoyl-CoA reductase/sulfur reductase-like enzyme
MMREMNADILVIGAGPAGLAAAQAAAAAGVERIVVIDRMEEPGGILRQCIHHGFGLCYFGEELTGPEYARRFIMILDSEPRIQLLTGAMALELTPQREVIFATPALGMVRCRARAVILAMGCRERPRGAVNIPGTRPAGVYSAGTVQRLMNIEGLRPGNRAVILGSGDIGLIMARRLTLEGIEVKAVLELLPYSSGLARNIVQCLDDFGIPLLLGHTVTKIAGKRRVEAVEAAPVTPDRRPVLERAFRMDCDTLVLSVGLIPEIELASGAGIRIDPGTGGPEVDSNYQTNVPGIFACGNVAHVHDLVDDVTVESQVAGKSAAAFTLGLESPGSRVRIKPGRNVRSVAPQWIDRNRPALLYIRPLFPEMGRTLRVGNGLRKERVVTPGETIRYQFKPEDLMPGMAELPVSIGEEEE